MPYRRLPNTDAARQKALNKAYEKAKSLPPFKLAFSQASYQRIQSFIVSFEKSMKEYKTAYNNQIEKNKDYIKALKKVRLYISHFIQVMNMAILRGDMQEAERKYYSLDENDKKLPSLNTEADVITWGENIIKGEDTRKMQGRTPVTNPTIALVKVHYEKFLDAYKFQKTLQKNNARALQELSNQRETADEIIQQVWNEVEETFKDESESDRRDKAADYGIVYVYRKNEISNLDISSTNSRISQLL